MKKKKKRRKNEDKNHLFTVNKNLGEKMRQVYIGNMEQVNKWLKKNQNAKIIDFKFSNKNICIIYEETDLVGY